MATTASPLLKSLSEHNVKACVSDVDHYRIRGGLAVESDYIVSVEPNNVKDTKAPSTKTAVLFQPFTVCKTYSAFRTLSHQLKLLVDKYTAESKTLPPSAIRVAKCCELVHHLIESQRTQYLGKVNYMYVKVLAKQRTQIINDVLETVLQYFPEQPQQHALLRDYCTMIETFFLTDHSVNVDDSPEGAQQQRAISTTPTSTAAREKDIDNAENPLTWIAGKILDPLKPLTQGNSSRELPSDAKNAPSVTVVPMTRRTRRSIIQRENDEQELVEAAGKEAKLLLDDDRPTTELLPNYARPTPVVKSPSTKLGKMIDNTPAIFVLIAAVVIYLLHKAENVEFRCPADFAMLIVFAAFCLGLHTPRPVIGGYDRPETMKGTIDFSGRKLLRRSMAATKAGAALNTNTIGDVEDDDHEHQQLIMSSPMAKFPIGAPLGSHFNCWSEPDPGEFQVRGPNYLHDKKKVASGEYLFPARGLDLFLTDTCPENVGRNSGVMGGRLREMPTFIINFRLPWGVLVFYCEIPDIFVPSIRACYEEGVEAPSEDELKKMTPGQRTVCRFLLNDMKYKNESLKIVPIVVDGPWVVRQVVGGKPAIVGNKLPINYVYQPPSGTDALYLEADLDIAGSSAARGILSVTRSYTQILTLNIGFVVQSNLQDELPEQMLVGVCLHGIDPLTAPPFPLITEDSIIMKESHDDDTGSVATTG